MTTVLALVAPDALARLAQPANLRLGHRIAARGGVELLTVHDDRVVGKVGGDTDEGQTRTTTFTASRGELHWRCTCSSDADLFCKHCVALAFALDAA